MKHILIFPNQRLRISVERARVASKNVRLVCTRHPTQVLDLIGAILRKIHATNAASRAKQLQ